MKPKFTDAHKYRRPYRSSVDTDIAATFRRIEAEKKARAEQDARDKAEAQAKTINLKARSA